MRSEKQRLQHEQNVMKEKIRDNGEKIKQNKILPYLVGNVGGGAFAKATESNALVILATDP